MSLLQTLSSIPATRYGSRSLLLLLLNPHADLLNHRAVPVPFTASLEDVADSWSTEHSIPIEDSIKNKYTRRSLLHTTYSYNAAGLG